MKQFNITSMPATKRKALEANLQKRVKVRRESSEEIESVTSMTSSDSGDNPTSDVDGNSDSEESEVRTIRLPSKLSLRKG
jgi:ribosomal RNA-processing protein 36